MAARNIAKKSTPRKAPGKREAKPTSLAPGTATTTVKPAASSAPVAAESGGRWEELQRYFKAVRTEFNRVTWPGDTNNFMESLVSKEMKGATMVVLLTLIIFATYLGLLDVFFVRLFGWVTRG